MGGIGLDLFERIRDCGVVPVVAPTVLSVAAELGAALVEAGLYSAEYLNPPYSPMLLIDRDGVATSLPYGVKTADYLLTALEPHLAH